jgi:hypothetical protein
MNKYSSKDEIKGLNEDMAKEHSFVHNNEEIE